MTTEPEDNFFLRAERFFASQSSTALTFDDISLATAYSEILPRQASLDVSLHESLNLHLPIISADMDTVTEAPMAIAMALNGGMGLIHYNMDARRQVKEVAKVKNYINGLIQDPFVAHPGDTIGEVLDLIERKQVQFRTFPVVDEKGKLVGLLPGRVVKPRYQDRLVREAMTPREDLRTIQESALGDEPVATADRFFDENIGIHKLLVVDGEERLKGLFTLSDIERIIEEARSEVRPARDSRFRLLCAAAIAIIRHPDGSLDRDRVLGQVGALIDEGVDAIALSTAHGHSSGVGEAIRLVREAFPSIPIIGGNVTSAEGVDFLASCGANVVKVGQGPGSICTTRQVAGVGIPQLSALYFCNRAARKAGVKVIADGGITKSGDLVKALTLADAAMCGSLLVGCREAPGRIF